MASGRHARVLCLINLDGVFQQLQNALELRVIGAARIRKAAVLGELLLVFFALVDEQSSITTIIDQQIAAILAWNSHHLLCAPPVLRQSLTLPRKNGGCARLGDGSSC